MVVNKIWHSQMAFVRRYDARLLSGAGTGIVDVCMNTRWTRLPVMVGPSANVSRAAHTKRRHERAGGQTKRELGTVSARSCT